MESKEGDIKPAIPANDTPDNSPVLGAGKLKQSRYEDVWPEDVHAAFMEAAALYPPMGKRRLKYYRVSTHGSEHLSDGNQAKSFGRCQLIQSYILEKTGMNRSRKQVSSHLQRLKKIHKDNPAMRLLFSERSQPPSEHCSAPQAVAIPPPDIFTNISFGTCHLKSDFDLTVNLQKTDGSSVFSSASEIPSLDGGSYNAFDLTDFHDQPSLFPHKFLSPQQSPTGTLHPALPSKDYLCELQGSLIFTGAIDGGVEVPVGPAFNTSASSISTRRLPSKLPIQGRQTGSDLATHFSRVVHSPVFQPTQQWISRDDSTDPICRNSPLTTTQLAFHTFQLIPQDKHRIDSGLGSDWMWPQNPDIPFGLREGTIGELCLRYPPAIYHYDPTCPEMRVGSPGIHSSPPESEISRLPDRFSYSAVTGPGTVSKSVSNGSTIDFLGQAVPESSENVASPLVIRPTPIYPISYIHTNYMPAPSLPP